MGEEVKSIRKADFKVGGESFQVRTDAAESTLRSLASYVDSKVEMHAPRGLRGDSHRRMILVAMDICGELFEAKQFIYKLQQKCDMQEQALKSLEESFQELASEL